MGNAQITLPSPLKIFIAFEVHSKVVHTMSVQFGCEHCSNLKKA